MSKKIHGRRYLFNEKKDILDYLEKHTYKNTSEKFKISETTLSRWRREIKSGSKKNRQKLFVSLPKFWFEYLNEQIESDVWEDYSDAFLSILRDYFRSQTSNRKEDLKYLDNVKEIIPELLELDPNIEAMLVLWKNEVIYKSYRWRSTEGIQNLIENWKNMYDQWISSSPWYKTENKRSLRVKEFEFQSNKYNIRDMSVKHLIGVQKIEDIPPTGEDQEKTKFILGLKRKLAEDSAYIFAKAKSLEGDFSLVMNTLKRVAMGALPPIGEETRDDKFKKSKGVFTRVSDEALKDEKLKELERIIQIKMNPLLMQLATQVNMPIKPEEMEVLDAIEKQLGKKLERITADPEQKISKRELFGIPWTHTDIDFPADKFPCHYMALNGKVILLSLLNLGLFEMPSEISNLRNLTYLCLNSNKLTDVPKTFSNLKSLECFLLDNNQFTEVPDSIIELPRLHYLYMRNNKISKIPVTLTNAWLARIEDPLYQGSIYLPCNLIFSGNPIDRDSLTEEQIELEQKSNFNMYRYFFFVID